MGEHVLTIPDQSEALRITERRTNDGGDDLMPKLSKHPLARSERGTPRSMDHVHLGRFDGTDFCQWYGRCADGYHRPIGRVMQIVEVHDGKA